MTGEVNVPVARNRLFVEGEVQLSRMAADVRRVLRGGAAWQVAPEITARASYYRVMDRGATSGVVSSRIDVDRGKLGLLGGLIATRRAFVPSLASEIGASTLASNEAFAGCQWPVRAYDLQVVIDVSSAPYRAVRLTTSVKIPLRSRSDIPSPNRSSTAAADPGRGTTGR
jgi:hypothetical protein